MQSEPFLLALYGSWAFVNLSEGSLLLRFLAVFKWRMSLLLVSLLLSSQKNGAANRPTLAGPTLSIIMCLLRQNRVAYRWRSTCTRVEHKWRPPLCFLGPRRAAAGFVFLYSLFTFLVNTARMLVVPFSCSCTYSLDGRKNLKTQILR